MTYHVLLRLGLGSGLLVSVMCIETVWYLGFMPWPACVPLFVYHIWFVYLDFDSLICVYCWYICYGREICLGSRLLYHRGPVYPRSVDLTHWYCGTHIIYMDMVMLISLWLCLVSCIMIACCAIVGSTMVEHIASYMYCTHHHSWISGISGRCVAVLLFGSVGHMTSVVAGSQFRSVWLRWHLV